jgi:FimV-like protein
MRTTISAFVALVAIAAASPQNAAAQASAQAAERDPAAAKPLTERALELLRRGEDATSAEEKLAAYSEGERLARQAVALDPTDADAHFAVFANHGRRLLAEGVGANPMKLLEVNRELDRCLALNPDHADALAARGGLYRQLPRLLGGSLDRAEEYLARAVALDPEAVGARIELAQTYCDKGEPERAAPLLEQAAYWADKKGKPRQLREARALLDELRRP